MARYTNAGRKRTFVATTFNYRAPEPERVDGPAEDGPSELSAPSTTPGSVDPADGETPRAKKKRKRSKNKKEDVPQKDDGVGAGEGRVEEGARSEVTGEETEEKVGDSQRGAIVKTQKLKKAMTMKKRSGGGKGAC